MAQTLKIKGIILKVADTPGKDKLLKIITETGLISAFMTFKKSAGKKSFIADVFSFGEFVLYETDKSNYLVNSFTPIEHFYGIRNDIVTLSAAAYFSSLVQIYASEPDMNFNELFDLIFEALKNISSGTDIKIIKPVFEFKICQLIGFEPCLEAQNKAQNYYFSLSDGRLFNDDCQNSIYLSRDLVYIIYKILNSKSCNAFGYIFSENEQLYRLAESYLLFQTERSFDSLEFLKGVL